MIKFNGIDNTQVDKERQKIEGIRKLELTLTEEGDVGTVSTLSDILLHVTGVMKMRNNERI
ncbi:hypothetical protein ACT7CV_15540 [Bacillus paranthracis]